MDVREIEAKSILNRCGIPGIDFAANPYANQTIYHKEFQHQPDKSGRIG